MTSVVRVNWFMRAENRSSLHMNTLTCAGLSNRSLQRRYTSMYIYWTCFGKHWLYFKFPFLYLRIKKFMSLKKYLISWQVSSFFKTENQNRTLLLTESVCHQAVPHEPWEQDILNFPILTNILILTNPY